ncbi:MAG: hypothetical protein QOI95_2230 [Acidimicrobiaceae bacterium]
MAPQVFSSFSLNGEEDFDPDAFTAATGLMPSRSWRKGEEARGRLRQHSSWSLAIGPDLTFDHCKQVERLLDLIEPHADAIRELRNGHGVEPQIGLSWGDLDGDESTPGFHFSVELLRRIVALGADLDCDV